MKINKNSDVGDVGALRGNIDSKSLILKMISMVVSLMMMRILMIILMKKYLLILILTNHVISRLGLNHLTIGQDQIQFVSSWVKIDFLVISTWT